MPEPSSLQTRGMSESKKAVLFSLTVDAQQPSSVQFTLVPCILPVVFGIREQVLVTFLTLEVFPSWQ